MTIVEPFGGYGETMDNGDSSAKSNRSIDVDMNLPSWNRGYGL